ncbi:helix-turn-helix domain-containing protein [Chryseolinea soli]|uniref:AraC family transcriptional regulator n=1 Tax=Chryseolinea soli TaxID=2321403 RepID=A0A385SFH1_9BACT|nr:helix-turn-helix domain-containing protein [Chryseolinea soli]AYB29126.1 AraC family transcriptional regulator [Chryseolinea soli]
MKDIVRVTSITQLHQAFGLAKPTHPLISILDVSKWVIGKEWVGVKATSDLYSIALKDASCGLEYGRNSYDFGEGVLIFTAPHQVLMKTKEQSQGEVNGWMLFFHPDLIRNTTLGQNIDHYHFFSYDVHEALHLSDAEQKILTDCINLIDKEIKERIDNHSQRVIVSTLELLLNYSQRFYERQFNTRSAQNKDVVSQFERLLKEYYNSGRFTETGTPSIDFFAEHIHLSANYLSDLLKKETGYSAKDHISNFVVEKAKTLLLSDNDSISGIAYKLGFNYPHYFSRLFKSKTGMTPQEYREIN